MHPITPRILPVAASLLFFTIHPSEATVLTNPTVTASAAPFSATFSVDKLFDGTVADYASLGGGAGTAFSTSNGTWAQFDFGAPISMDRLIVVTRANNVDVVGTSRLILSIDGIFDGSDTIFTFDPTGQNAHGFIQEFARTTARFARWEVTTSTGTSQNLGAMEMRFLDTPTGSMVANVAVYNGATPFADAFKFENAINGDAGRGAPDYEYASQSLGAGTFLDFDFGGIQPITGFDFFDRIPAVDRTSQFDLIFSNDPTFSSIIETKSFSPGATGWGYSQEFAAVNARYVRYDAVTTTGPSNNAGMQEIVFYAGVPEPSTAALLAMVPVAGLLLRRRRG